MGNYKNLFIKSILTIEIFTYIVPVPLVAYLVLVLGRYTDDSVSLIGYFFGLTIVLIITLIHGILSKLFLKRLSDDLNNSETLDYYKLSKHKQSLLKYPLKEGYNCAVRWFYGATLMPIFAGAFTGITKGRVLIGIIAAVMSAPLGFVVNYFGAETINYRLLSDPIFSNIKVEKNNSGISRLSIKFSMMALVILWLCFISYFSISYASALKIIDEKGIIMHYIIISITILYVSVFSLLRFHHLIKNRLAGIIDIIKRTAEGDLSVKINTTSNDDLGEISESIILMQEGLRKIAIGTVDESSRISDTVLSATTSMKNLAKDIEEVATITE